MIKTTNEKYIVVLMFFIITLLLSLIIPVKYMQLFTSPVTLIFIAYIFKDELKRMNWNTVLKNEAAYSQSINALILALFGQTIFNYLSIHLMNPTIPDLLPLFMPIISVYTVISAPIIEEIIFRRIVYGALQRNKAKFSILAATTSSVLFAAMHMNLTYLAGYFVVGMIFCYFYYKTKSLYTTILAHMYFNTYVLLVQSIHM